MRVMEVLQQKKAQKGLLKEIWQGDMIWVRMPLFCSVERCGNSNYRYGGFGGTI